MGRPFSYKCTTKALDTFPESWTGAKGTKLWAIKFPAAYEWANVKHSIQAYYQIVGTLPKANVTGGPPGQPPSYTDSLEQWTYRCNKCPPSAIHSARNACIKCIMAMRDNRMDLGLMELKEDRLPVHIETHGKAEFMEAFDNLPAAGSVELSLSAFVRFTIGFVGLENFCVASAVTVVTLFKQYCQAVGGPGKQDAWVDAMRKVESLSPILSIYTRG